MSKDKIANPNRANAADKELGDFQMRQVIRIGIVGLLCYWALQIVFPLLGLILWAIILAVAAYPIFEWTKNRLRGQAIVASIFVCLLGIVLVIAPLLFLTNSLIETIQFLAAKFKSGTLVVPKPPDMVADWPLVGPYLYRGWDIASTDMEKAFADYSEYLLSAGRYAVVTVAHTGFEVIVFLFSIILAGYLFVAGPRMIPGVIRFVERAAPGHGESYVETVGRTIRSVAQGIIGVALLQSIVSGLVLLLFRVPGAGLITFIAFLLGITQIGPGLVLLPIAVWALFTGDLTWSIPLAVILVAITFLDNILKPFVLAKGLSTPMLVILIGVLGGLAYHGLIGIFLGPVVLAVGWELLLIWTEKPVGVDGSPSPPR